MKLDTSGSTYPSVYFLVLLTQTKSLSDGLCFRTAGLMCPIREHFDTSVCTYFLCFALVFAHTDQVYLFTIDRGLAPTDTVCSASQLGPTLSETKIVFF